jgi:WD40 repeat protein
VNSGPDDGLYRVDARGSTGVQVGEGNTQIIYSYSRLTWTDGVVAAPLTSLSGVVESPYRGLGAYEERDAAFFFGREEAATQLLTRMSGALDGVSLLAVSGASGAGKSSLLRAGVLPRLRGAGLQAAPGAASWPCLVLTPGRSPLDELAVRVALLAGADAAAVRRGLETNPAGFALTARQAALAQAPAPIMIGDPAAVQASKERRLLLVVDQFEQVFTQCTDEDERRAFVSALHASALPGHGRDGAAGALVVLGVRADFEARCAGYAELASAIQHRYLVMPMTRRQLRIAITGPAKVAGSQVDDDLTGVLLAEVQDRRPGSTMAGVLPLLSHALDQAWRSRAGRTLALADYERAGGIEGAVAVSAQRAYDQLTPGQQAAARHVFTRLAAVSDAGVDTADRATRAELTAGKTSAQTADVEAVLEAFAAERLLTLAADSVEISHEALLTAWPLLRDTWLAETHADRIVATRLRNTTAEWERSRDPSYLYRGTLLHAATEAAERAIADPARHVPLGGAERDFLHASSRARRRAARWRLAAIAALIALSLAAVSIAGWAVDSAAISARNAAIAARQHAVALSRQLAAESLTADPAAPLIARQLAVAAWRVFPTSQAASAMTIMLAEQQQAGMLPVTSASGGVSAVAFSPGGKRLATLAADGSPRLWNPATGHPAGPPFFAGRARSREAPSPGAGGSMAFSPDGRLLATAGPDGKVRLWNPATGRLVGAPLPAGALPPGARGQIGVVISMAFSPDGKLLATADSNGSARLWNPATGHPVGPPLPQSTSGINGVAFSPDGRLLATADSDGTVRLWNLAGRPVGAPLPVDTGPSGGVIAVAFSPDGKLLATADYHGTVRLWNPATSRPAETLRSGSAAGVNGLAFSPDGKLLAIADYDGTARLANVATGRPAGAPAPISTKSSGVDNVAFSPDGRLLATAGYDSTIRVMNVATGLLARSPIPITDGPGGLNDMEFSPDGTRLATVSFDGTVRVLSLVTGRPTGVPIRVSLPDEAGAGSSVNGVAFSPDGRLLAIANADGTVRLWNPATGHPASAPLAADTGPYSAGVTGVAFSPDGKLLAAAGVDAAVRVLSLITGHRIRSPLQADTGNCLVDMAFSPDGKVLAASGSDGTVRLWDPATGRHIGSPISADSGNCIIGMAFSPGGKILATAYGGSDDTVRLWNPATGRAMGASVPVGSSDGVTALAFSHDGGLVATVGKDSTGRVLVQLWALGLFTNPYAELCPSVGPPTREEWNQYAPGEQLPKVCT